MTPEAELGFFSAVFWSLAVAMLLLVITGSAMGCTKSEEILTLSLLEFRILIGWTFGRSRGEKGAWGAFPQRVFAKDASGASQRRFT